MENSIAFLEEQFNAQRTMLEDALDALDQKNQVLEKSNYELEEKRFELEQFIYRLNHDFKSPVTTIKGLTDLLEFEEIGTQKIVLKLRDTIARLDSLITNLSYFYITTQVNKDFVEIHKIITNTLLKFNQEILKHQIQIKLEIDDNVKNKIVSIADFDAIFGSLISNCINFCDDFKEVKIINLSIGTDSDFLIISIKDNG